MADSCLLSIIVPIYNTQSYLKRCVDSLLNQTIPTNDFEIILVDDGSTDESAKICDEYACQYKNIIVAHKSNGGQSSARNLGLSLAKGKYISFVDSDDFVHPQMCEILLNHLLQSNVDTVVCSYERYSNEEPPKLRNFTNSDILFHTVNNSEIINNYWHYAKGILGMAPWNKIYKKQIFENNLFKEGIIYEDHYILPEIIKRSKHISFTDLKLYYYYQSENSTIRSAFTVKNLSLLRVWEESIFPFLNNYSNKENLDLAENYYINEFKNTVYNIQTNHSKNCNIKPIYKKLYKKLVIKQRKINPKNEGWFSSLFFLISLININWSCLLTCFLFSHRGKMFWKGY